ITLLLTVHQLSCSKQLTNFVAPNSSPNTLTTRMLYSIVIMCLALTGCSAVAPVTLTTRDKLAFLNAHNTARKQVNVPDLAWNITLERFSRQYISSCVYKHSGGPYGENLYVSSPTDVNNTRVAEASVAGWNSEKALVDYPTWKCILTGKCGHYSQVVWKTTKTVGCAIINCEPPFNNLVVCEYWPR
ncbi:unnamed protein product, partial [Lymnaea stagnalis]